MAPFRFCESRKASFRYLASSEAGRAGYQKEAPVVIHNRWTKKKNPSRGG